MHFMGCSSGIQSNVLAVLALTAVLTLAGSHRSAAAVTTGLFRIVSEHPSEESDREFSAGICNASRPLNDHLYQLVGWCRRLHLGPGCFTRGAVACLFKKYIDIVRGADLDGVVMNSEELGKRLLVFRDNLLAVSSEIEARLSAPSSVRGAARFGITKFMHLSAAEFRDRYLTSLKTNVTARREFEASISGGSSLLRRRRRSAVLAARPDRVDWRDAGVVTSVKNQGSCGACWAFAVTEVAESEFAHRGLGPLTELSVQQVTDCTRCPVCAGCRGGDICQTALFFSQSQSPSNHMVEASVYPYTGKDGSCLQVASGYRVQTGNVRCESFVNYEDALLDLLWQSGTAAVAVDAHMWQYYVDGTIMHNCAAELNHAVQLVGYDLTSGPAPFFLLRNSWGADWGMGGYLQIAQGSNLCGLAQDVVTFSVVA